jgi:hypothetical protein
MSENELESTADAEAQASREERGATVESDAAALAEELSIDEPTADEVFIASEVLAFDPPSVPDGTAAGKNAHLTSRQIRQNRQRGR